MRKARIDCRSARIRVALEVIDHADYESDVSFCRGPPEGTPLKEVSSKFRIFWKIDIRVYLAVIDNADYESDVHSTRVLIIFIFFMSSHIRTKHKKDKKLVKNASGDLKTWKREDDSYDGPLSF